MKDYYAPIVREFLFPVSQWLRGCNYREKLREARSNQSLDRKQIEDLQFKKLSLLLQHAFAHVPYYMDLFNRMGITPADIQTWNDFRCLPILTKADVREHYQRFISEKPRGPVRHYRTSGSSGKPLNVLTSEISIAAEYACRWRAYQHWGIQIGDRVVYIREQDDYLLNPNIKNWFNKYFYFPLKARIFNYWFFPVSLVSEHALKNQWNFIQRYNPKYFHTFPSTIYMLAEMIKETGKDGRLPNLKLIVTGSEVLYEFQKELIQEVFNCPVAENYGSFEIGIAANTFPCGAMHTNDDFVIVEVIKEKPQDELGMLVGTRLDNWEFPLIRYNLEDLVPPLAEHDDCSIGLNFLKIDSIFGRNFNSLRLPDGRILHGKFFFDLLKLTPNIRQFQVIQREINRFEILVITDPGTNFETTQAYMQDRLNAHLSTVTCTITPVLSIPVSASGKFDVIRTNLPDSPAL